MSIKVYYPDYSDTPKEKNEWNDPLYLATDRKYLKHNIKIVSELPMTVLEVSSNGTYDCTDYTDVAVNYLDYNGEYSFI